MKMRIVLAALVIVLGTVAAWITPAGMSAAGARSLRRTATPTPRSTTPASLLLQPTPNYAYCWVFARENAPLFADPDLTTLMVIVPEREKITTLARIPADAEHDARYWVEYRQYRGWTGEAMGWDFSRCDRTLVPVTAALQDFEPQGERAICQGTVEAATDINVRPAPNTYWAPVTTLSPGDSVAVFGRNAAANWYQVRYGDAGWDTGWIAAFLLAVDCPPGVEPLYWPAP
jgi:uncharacterized protein YgiM (DUF1202 family)